MLWICKLLSLTLALSLFVAPIPSLAGSLTLLGAGSFTAPAADTTAPTITSSNSASVAENATLAHALTANETVTWSLTGGADQADFDISGSTLRWVGNITRDYEIPADADTNNTYIVQVTATDTATNATNQTITITVTDVGEGGSVAWNSADKAAAITLTNSDLTASHTAGGAYSYGNVRSTEITGKKVFSAVVSYSGDGQAYIGIAPSTAGLTTQQVSQVGQNSIVVFLEAGSIRQNGAYAGDYGNASPAPSGTRVTVIVDTVSGTKKVWFAKNNVIDGDPAAGTGGFTFTGSMYPLFGGYRGSGAVSAIASFSNDGSGFTLPTGFTWVQ